MTSDNAAPFLAARDFLVRHREDYATAYRDFRWPQLDRFNWALDYFDPMARGNAQPALWLVDEGAGETKLSFAQLSERSNRVANFLRALGVRRGDRILLMLGNVAPLWETMLAAMKLGAVIVPATMLLARNDLADRFARGRVRHVIAAADAAAKFADLPGDYTRIAVGKDVPGWLSYRKRLRGAGAVRAGWRDARRRSVPSLFHLRHDRDAEARFAQSSELSGRAFVDDVLDRIAAGRCAFEHFVAGLGQACLELFLCSVECGATVFIVNQRRFNARGLLDTIVRCGVTTFCAPPTVWRMLIQEDLAAWPVRLKELISAGEPLNPEVIEQVKAAWRLTIRDGYGQTETTALVGNTPGQKIKPGSMGRPLPGYRVALLDPDGAAHREGEICLELEPRPTGLMQGYQGDDGEVVPIGGTVYRTGDVATLDDDGYLTYVGRADDVFKSSDYRISPFELESVLIEHPAVAEAAIVPSPDPMRLAVPKAFVALAGGQAPDRDTALSIFRHCRQALAPFKRVRRLEFADLPKTISGKIRRVELRRAEAANRDQGKRAVLEFWEEDFSENELRPQRERV